jgi:biopolymer transport protein ExbB
MASLFLMFFVALYLYFERLMAINAASKSTLTSWDKSEKIKNGRLTCAKIACAHSKSPVARLIEKGISRIGKPLEDINTAIENAGKLEITKRKKRSMLLPFQEQVL